MPYTADQTGPRIEDPNPIPDSYNLIVIQKNRGKDLQDVILRRCSWRFCSARVVRMVARGIPLDDIYAVSCLESSSRMIPAIEINLWPPEYETRTIEENKTRQQIATEMRQKALGKP